MMPSSSSLSSLARSKLSVGARERNSLHRWVLLKNSIVSALPLSLSLPVAAPHQQQSQPTTPPPSPTSSTYSEDEEEDFMFPDVGGFLDCAATHDDDDNSSDEAQWLDSLLETLGDEDDDEFSSVLDSHILSTLPSPMSSSDDLSIEAYYLPPIYPPYHPPLVHPSYPYPMYDDPLPYQDDLAADDMSVPEAIEDTSDDESDAPETPIGQSLLYPPVDQQRIESRSSSSDPIVYVNDLQFYPFDVDPLPFADAHISPHQQSPHHEPPYSTANYQEC